jgi:hypothetical protein
MAQHGTHNTDPWAQRIIYDGSVVCIEISISGKASVQVHVLRTVHTSCPLRILCHKFLRPFDNRVTVNTVNKVGCKLQTYISFRHLDLADELINK